MVPNWPMCALHGVACMGCMGLRSRAWHILHGGVPTDFGMCLLLIEDVFTQDLCRAAGCGGGGDGL